MAGCINQANVKFSNIFRPGAGSYRDLAQDQDQIIDAQEISVELKSSGDGEQEVDRSVAHKQQTSSRKWGKVAKIAVIVLFFFIVGFLLGYVSHRTPTPSSYPTENNGEEPAFKPANNEHTPRFTEWNSVNHALRDKLTTTDWNTILTEFSSSDHQAGSAGDRALHQKVLDTFTSLEMQPWVDSHFVKLQVPSGEGNKVFIGSEVVATPKGFLAYSAQGTKQGKVVYANYGRTEDLENLLNMGMNLTENIGLVRAGHISLAQKVANAARFGLAAVLIYQETDTETKSSTELYGQVHLGTGDPYTPGFPSFHHGQFPPSKSSGLFDIVAQSITAQTARKIHERMGGKEAPRNFQGALPGISTYRVGGDTDVTVTVNNTLVDTNIYNVFGVIKGFVDPDRYVVLGAQRDAFSHGFAKATVGTALLVELARAITDMIKDGFRPRRSLLFASWSGGDFGNVGSTEWLEGYLPSLNLRAFTYISLDSTVSGVNRFRASSSPLLYKLLYDTTAEVSSPRSAQTSIKDDYALSLENKLFLEDMRIEDGAYPFLAFSGIPSVSFRFVSDTDYKYLGTSLDTQENLNQTINNKLRDVCTCVAHTAGQMALRLVHDHVLKLNIDEYKSVFMKNAKMTMREIIRVKELSTKATWLTSAIGSYSRAVSTLRSDIENSDLDDAQTCRNINDRIMRVEHNLLSPFVTPRDVPFRHIVFGSGSYSFSTLLQHLTDLKQQAAGADADLFRSQFALITWTIQSCANDLAGNVWVLNNNI